MTRSGWILVLAGVCAVFVIWLYLNPLTDEQRAAAAARAALADQRAAERKALQAAQRDEKRAKADFDRTLCELQETCAEYAKARHDCAVAGDFAKCLEVRMSTSLYYAGMCSNDGRLTLDVESPGTLRCLALQWLPASD